MGFCRARAVGRLLAVATSILATLEPTSSDTARLPVRRHPRPTASRTPATAGVLYETDSRARPEPGAAAQADPLPGPCRRAPRRLAATAGDPDRLRASRVGPGRVATGRRPVP